VATAKFGTRSLLLQDRFGRFISEIEQAGDKLLEDTVKDMAETAKKMAPSRSGELRRGIHPVQITPREWKVVSTADHTLPIEFGYRAHRITGKFPGFESNKAAFGRWIWNHRWFGPYGSGKPYENWGPGVGSSVTSPARGPRPFLRPAFELHFGAARAEMRRRYPG
jgi:hypothetical protein